MRPAPHHAGAGASGRAALMCGIAGLLSLDGGTPPDPAELAAMSAALAHRGPDGAGELLDGALALAIRRLAIVDPVGGHQPLACEDGGVHVVCNGEIYNAPALRRELERRGHRFRDAQRRGGARPPLRGARHGVPRTRCAACSRSRCGTRASAGCVLARDPFGIKPLVYALAPGAARRSPPSSRR